MSAKHGFLIFFCLSLSGCAHMGRIESDNPLLDAAFNLTAAVLAQDDEPVWRKTGVPTKPVIVLPEPCPKLSLDKCLPPAKGIHWTGKAKKIR